MKINNCCIIKKNSRKRCLNKSTRLYNYKFYCKDHFNKKLHLLNKKKKVHFNLLLNQLTFI
jgi:hypothetical protein